MTTELVFQLPAGGTGLVFGDDGTPAEVHYSATVVAQFPALSLSVRMIPDRRVAVTGTFPGLTVAATAQYASHAARPLVGEAASAWQCANESESGIDSGFTGSDQLPAGAESSWQAGGRCVGNATVAAFAGAVRIARLQRASRFSAAVRLRALGSTLVLQDALRGARLARRSDYASAVRLAALQRSSRYQDADHRPRSAITSRFEQGVPVRAGWSGAFGPGSRLVFVITSPAQQAIRPPAGIWVKPIEPETPGHTPTPDLLFCRLADGTAALLFGDICDATDGPIVVPVRRVYYVVNTQSLVRVSDGKVIQGADLRLSIDVDSWVWGWSASVPGRHLSDLLVSVDEQIELEAQINGNAFRLVVERVSRDRRFAQSTLAVSGRGRAAWLADPYAPVRSYTNSQDRLAQQLMADALTENGVSLGWELDWQITDWLVPAGGWSQSGTPMDACLAIAEAAGAYLQAHPSAMTLRVLPRYPAAPWHWAELTPDIELPEDVCASEGIEWVDKPAYNTVFVAGQTGGVLGHVTRAGTDGGMPAPMVTDPLMTHSDAVRQRGLSILSDTGRQALISLSLPVLAETGIILPGTLVQYAENGNTHIGLARAVDVAASFPKVRQTIRLETHVL